VRDDVIVHADFVGAVYASDPGDVTTATFTTRTETLVPMQLTSPIDRRELEHWGYALADEVRRDLVEALARKVERAGRMMHSAPEMFQSDEPERDRVWLTIRVITRESDQGEWPAIWRAYHEDWG
jgi:hypothetical protein